MEPLPDRSARPLPESAHPPNVRVIHLSLQPKTWLGKLLAAIAGLTAMLAAFLFSVIAFVIVALIAVVAVVYFLWVTRRLRRAMRSQTSDVGPQTIDASQRTANPNAQTIDATPSGREIQ